MLVILDSWWGGYASWVVLELITPVYDSYLGVRTYGAMNTEDPCPGSGFEIVIIIVWLITLTPHVPQRKIYVLFSHSPGLSFQVYEHPSRF